MSALVALAGCALVAVALADAVITALSLVRGTGPVGGRVARGTWRTLLALHARVPRGTRLLEWSGTLTLAITYLVQVVQAVVHKRVLAEQIHALGQDAAGIVAGGWTGNGFSPMFETSRNRAGRPPEPWCWTPAPARRCRSRRPGNPSGTSGCWSPTGDTPARASGRRCWATPPRRPGGPA